MQIKSELLEIKCKRKPDEIIWIFFIKITLDLCKILKLEIPEILDQIVTLSEENWKSIFLWKTFLEDSFPGNPNSEAVMLRHRDTNATLANSKVYIFSVPPTRSHCLLKFKGVNT